MKKIIVFTILIFNLLSCVNIENKTTFESIAKDTTKKQQNYIMLEKVMENQKKNVKDNACSKLPYKQQLDSIKKFTTPDSVLSIDTDFINNTLFDRKVKINLSQYLKENDCLPCRYAKKTLISENEGFHNIGDIDGDGKNDFVFVLFPLNWCEEGQSYYFTNKNIPRLLTESNCCHPNSIFNVGDIDEDGICEIGQYYSSCASRFKALIVLTLKDDNWKEIGNCVFDLGYSRVESDYKLFVQKTEKGKFRMLEITDLTDSVKYYGKKHWIDFEF